MREALPIPKKEVKQIIRSKRGVTVGMRPTR